MEILTYTAHIGIAVVFITSLAIFLAIMFAPRNVPKRRNQKRRGK